MRRIDFYCLISREVVGGKKQQFRWLLVERIRLPSCLTFMLSQDCCLKVGWFEMVQNLS